MASSDRQYEIVVFGATGYTGTYTAEHITAHLPTNLKWAIAGRSESKLQKLVQELRSLNPDREPPSIETAELTHDSLLQLARKTKVLIATVGPYANHGEPAYAACAEAGTHYIDVTGEVPWTKQMAEKYGATAKKNGAIMISQCGVESAPADLICWSIVQYARKHFSSGVKEVVLSTQEMRVAASGGTLATAFNLFDVYSPSALAAAMSPWSLSTIDKPTQKSSGPSLISRILGVRSVPTLGTLTPNPFGAADVPIVHRSWSLHSAGKLYGPNFQMTPYMRSRNVLLAILTHVLVNVGMLVLLLSPVRALAKRFIYAPGEGPTKEESKEHFIRYLAASYTDAEGSGAGASKRLLASMQYSGSMYALSGALLGEAARVLARESEGTVAKELGGGHLTPATLGEPYARRMADAGLECKVYEEK